MAAVKGGHGGCRLCNKLPCSWKGPGALVHLHVGNYASMCHHKWSQDKKRQYQRLLNPAVNNHGMINLEVNSSAELCVSFTQFYKLLNMESSLLFNV